MTVIYSSNYHEITLVVTNRVESRNCNCKESTPVWIWNWFIPDSTLQLCRLKLIKLTVESIISLYYSYYVYHIRGLSLLSLPCFIEAQARNLANEFELTLDTLYINISFTEQDMVILHNQLSHYSPVDANTKKFKVSDTVIYVCNLRHSIALCVHCNVTVRLKVITHPSTLLLFSAAKPEFLLAVVITTRLYR